MEEIRVLFDSVTFDLDGTLVDTIDDLTVACNLTLSYFGLKAITKADVQKFNGKGSRALIEGCLAINHQSKVSETLLDHAQRLYLTNYRATSGFFANIIPGAIKSLTEWSKSGIKMAAVTNKPSPIAKSLLSRLDMERHFQEVVTRTSTPFRKPHPQPILYACEILGTQAHRNLHIGDSRSDQLSAKAAKCFFVQANSKDFIITPEYLIANQSLIQPN